MINKWLSNRDKKNIRQLKKRQEKKLALKKKFEKIDLINRDRAK